jgi:hypothetical protein
MPSQHKRHRQQPRDSRYQAMAQVLHISYRAISSRLIYKALLSLGDLVLQRSASQRGLGTSRYLVPSSR